MRLLFLLMATATATTTTSITTTAKSLYNINNNRMLRPKLSASFTTTGSTIRKRPFFVLSSSFGGGGWNMNGNNNNNNNVNKNERYKRRQRQMIGSLQQPPFLFSLSSSSSASSISFIGTRNAYTIDNSSNNIKVQLHQHRTYNRCSQSICCSSSVLLLHGLGRCHNYNFPTTSSGPSPSPNSSASSSREGSCLFFGSKADGIISTTNNTSTNNDENEIINKDDDNNTGVVVTIIGKENNEAVSATATTTATATATATIIVKEDGGEGVKEDDNDNDDDDGFIHIENDQTDVPIIDYNRIRSTVRKIRNCIGYDKYGVSIFLINDIEMKQINNETRGMNQPTDILSFPFQELTNIPGIIKEPKFSTIIPEYYQLGDILINVPYIVRRCKEDELYNNNKKKNENNDIGNNDTDRDDNNNTTTSDTNRDEDEYEDIYEEDGEDNDDDTDTDGYDYDYDDDRGVSGAMSTIYDPETRINMLLVHGILHLVGYDHENDHDYEIMVSAEEDILSKLGLFQK